MTIILQTKQDTADNLQCEFNVTGTTLNLTCAYSSDESSSTLSFSVSDFPNSDKDWQAYLIENDIANKKIGKPVSLNPLTLGERMTRQEYLEREGRQPLVIVLAPYAIDKVGLDGLTYLVRLKDEDSFTCSLPYTVGSPDQNATVRGNVMKPVTFGSNSVSVAEGGEALITLMHPGNSSTPVDVYLESTGGLIAKQRVTVNPGAPTTVKFLPLGLSSGDSCKVKVGYFNFPGVNSCDITVI